MQISSDTSPQRGLEASSGEDVIGSAKHLQALLKALLKDDVNPEDVNASRNTSGLCLDDLLRLSPAQVGAKQAWAQQVWRALRRPDELCPSPAGLELEISPMQVQRQTNAKIIAWILRHAAVYELSQLEHGCWIIQKALEVVDASIAKEEPLRQLCANLEPKALLAGGFKGNVNRALQDKHANFALQKCIEVLPRQSTQFILEEIGRQPGGAVLAAKSKSGCRVLQRLIEHFWDERVQSPGLKLIVEQLIEEDENPSMVEANTTMNDPRTSKRLVNDPYGNFVFKSLLEHHAWDDLVVGRVLVRDIHSLALSFYSSHVLSFVLTAPPLEYGKHQTSIIEALKGSGDGTPESERKKSEFLKLEKTKMGSFVFKQANALLPEPPAAISKSVKGKKGSGISGASSSKGGRKGRLPRAK